jgi:uridine kinase
LRKWRESNPSSSERILVATLLNGEISSTHTKVEPKVASAAPVFLDSAEGIAVYRRSLAFLLSIAVSQELRGGRVAVTQAMKDYFVAELSAGGDAVEISAELLSRLGRSMRLLVDRALPISSTVLSYQRALQYFSPIDTDTGQRSRSFSSLLVRSLHEPYIPVYTCGGTAGPNDDDAKAAAAAAVAATAEISTESADEGTPFLALDVGVLVPSTAALTDFNLSMCDGQLVVQFSQISGGWQQAQPVRTEGAMWMAVRECTKWRQVQGLNCLGALNALTGSAPETIDQRVQLAEGLQIRKIGEIAETITNGSSGNGSLRLVVVAGGPGSGQAFFASKLVTQLGVLGVRAVQLSAADYTGGHDTGRAGGGGDASTPAETSGRGMSVGEGMSIGEGVSTGEADAHEEGIVRYLRDMQRLIDGEDVTAPNGKRLRLQANGILVTPDVGLAIRAERLQALRISPASIFSVFVDPLPQLNSDDLNCVSAIETRLLRYVVMQFRRKRVVAKDSIGGWRRAEVDTQADMRAAAEQANVIFISSLLFEVCIY